MDSFDGHWDEHRDVLRTPTFGDRQESIASLRDVDPMKEFLETPINLEDLSQYGLLDDDDMAPVQSNSSGGYINLDDPKKEQIILQQQQLYESWARYGEGMDHINSSLGDTHLFNDNHDVVMSDHRPFPSIKQEYDDGEYGSVTSADSDVPSSSRTSSFRHNVNNKKVDPIKALKDYKPQTRARKYSLKKDAEKDASYKLKRARNNDAVRRSRTKAKEAQNVVAEENVLLKKENAQLKKENAQLKKELQMLRAGRAEPRL